MTLTVQELLAGIIPLVGDPKIRLVAPADGAQVGVPPQVVLAEEAEATCRPEGSVSANATPFNAIEFGFVSVKTKAEVPLTAIGLEENVLVRVGGFGMAHPVNVTLSRNTSDPDAVLPALKK